MCLLLEQMLITVSSPNDAAVNVHHVQRCQHVCVSAGLVGSLLSFGRSYAAFSSPVTVDVLLRFSLTLMNSGAWSSCFSCSFSNCKKEEWWLSVHAKGQQCISYIKTVGFIIAGCPVIIAQS